MTFIAETKRTRGRRNIISREQVMLTAQDLIGAKGVACCTMADIARMLNVSVMALYTYFPSRSALLAALAEAAFEELQIPEHGGEWQRFVQDWMMSLDEYLTRHPAARALLFAGVAMPRVWVTIWLPILRLFAAEGLEGERLSFATEWFGRFAFEVLAGRDQTTPHAVIGQMLQSKAIAPEDKDLLNGLLAMREDDVRNRRLLRRNDDLFQFSVSRGIAGLEQIMACEQAPPLPTH